MSSIQKVILLIVSGVCLYFWGRFTGGEDALFWVWAFAAMGWFFLVFNVLKNIYINGE